MRGLAMSVLVGVVLTACSAGPADTSAAGGETLTQRQRDSIVGASSLPGARAVQKALDASEASAARTGRLDSILRP